MKFHRQFKGINKEVIKLLFAQLVCFLEVMQKEGIMHRDMKPQNVMFDDNYNIKIIDFGDARKVDEEMEADEDDDEGKSPFEEQEDEP